MKPVIHLDRNIGVGGALVGWKGQVNTFADLPDATINDGEFYIVLNPTGSRLLLNYKASGLYRAEGGVWVKKNDVQLLLNDEQFTVYNSVDGSKVIKFDASQINTGTIRTATWQDKDGVVAFLSDIGSGTGGETFKIDAADPIAGFFIDKVIDSLDLIQLINTNPLGWNVEFNLTQRNYVIVRNVAPTVNDDLTDPLEHRIGQLWMHIVDPQTTDYYIARDLTIGAAIWDKLFTTVDGTLVLDGALILNNSVTVNINTNEDNLLINGLSNTVLVRLNNTGNNDLTGIIPADITKSQMIILQNVGSGLIRLKNNSASSDPNNRFLIGVNTNLAQDEGITLVYDEIDNRWRKA
jgi:hypothetical protein